MGGSPRLGKRQLEIQLLLQTLGRLRQCCQQTQAFSQMCDRFDRRRALERVLTGLLPVGNRLLGVARFAVVVRQ